MLAAVGVDANGEKRTRSGSGRAKREDCGGPDASRGPRRARLLTWQTIGCG